MDPFEVRDEALFRAPMTFRLPGYVAREAELDLVPGSIENPEPLRDEFGLLWTIYRNFPRIIREYVAYALEHISGASKSVSPSQAGYGTVPELVVYGGLLKRGYDPQVTRSKGFYFQSSMLGGRVPGGAVVDFLVIVGSGERVGVRVQSKFHALQDPFGLGTQKVYADEAQRLRLLTNRTITRLVDVNLPPLRALENGPEAAVYREFERILYGR